MNDCKKFNQISLPEKKKNYSHLNVNMEDIIDADYA